MDPSSARAHFQLSRAWQERGDEQRAIEELKAAIQIDPQHERAHYVLGRLYQKQGNTDLAQKELEAHRNIKEKDKQAQYQRLLITIRDPDRPAPR